MNYFNNIFGVSETILEKYGAFNISLINDLPTFVDPFLLYGSTKAEYKKLHEDIVKYLAFLRNKSARGGITKSEIKSWYMFQEIKQNWLGFSLVGNEGAGLGTKFGDAMSKSIHIIFENIHDEKITDTSHLEKAGLFQVGVGKDNISDFTCNLIKGYLLDYTQKFALKFLNKGQVRLFNVSKAYFDYEIERWMPKQYTLPCYNDDYVILTPRDILTKDENWINGNDLRGDFVGICESIPNDVLRREVSQFYKRQLPAPTIVGKGKNRRHKKPTNNELASAREKTILKFPQIIDYFIKIKELNKEKAQSVSDEKIGEIEELFQKQVKRLIDILTEETPFYEYTPESSYEESLKRVHFLKDVIENKDGYRLFYVKNKPIKREADLQLIYRLTWYTSSFDVNREVNNGRGPADYVVSYGARNKSIVEFKLASNSKLKMNLENQTKIYEKASNTKKSIKVIMYFDSSELRTVQAVLKELKLEDDESIVLIDAGNNKPSASNVKS